MSREWWVTASGANLLSGLDSFNSDTGVWENDTNNPALLHRYHIIEFLKEIPAARDSFNRLYPTMGEEEKERLDEIAHASKFRAKNPKDVEDTFQRRMNTVGIYTTGKRGGGN